MTGMVRGIGIDTVRVARFNHWNSYGVRLSRVFSDDELDYCRQKNVGTPASLAARFAVKEAVFKALNQAYPHARLLFFSFIRACRVIVTDCAPVVIIDWIALAVSPIEVLISITHTDKYASAIALVHEIA